MASLSLGAWRPLIRTVAGQGQVALTVDDAPTPEALPAMLDLLDQHRAKATFFMSGFRALRALDLVAETVRRGHAVYAHGWEHVRLDRCPITRLAQDLERSEELLRRFRPTPRPYLIRLPYNGGYRNARIHRALEAWSPGCQIAHWQLSTEDHVIASKHSTEADARAEIATQVARLANSPNLANALLLMHDQPVNEVPDGGLKAWVTVELMRQLLEMLSARGLASVAVTPRPSVPVWERFILR
ncbi:putative Chitooligosaccharide deacetylase [Rhodospirillaceae bacterium LM-1]|nr:putative Chitooligosaccharide deacetylase [Rhodospirillaceae bacterium LM-1]